MTVSNLKDMLDCEDEYFVRADALLRNPDDPVALLEMFHLLSKDGKEELSHHWLPLAKRAMECAATDDINIVFNYATALARSGETRLAIDQYMRALQIAPDDTWKGEICDNLGISWRAASDPKQAMRWYMKALDYKPGCPYVRQDLAISTLQAGYINKGLQLHEVRREISEAKRKKGAPKNELGLLPDGVTHWDDGPLDGRPITIYHEEGIGDFFMWCRFFGRLRDHFAGKILLTGKSIDVLEFVNEQMGFDGVVPLKEARGVVVGSLTAPWRCGVDHDDIKGTPYFSVGPARIPRRGRLNVGLVWRGNAVFKRDHIRSMAFSEFTPLFDLPTVAFYSLQVGDAAKEVDKLGYSGFVAKLDGLATDWKATAGLVQALDVILTVDTAVAHLAGALGKPVLMLTYHNSDWRWPRHSEKTNWYNSMRVIRQASPGDWGSCIARVRPILEEMRGELQAAA